MITKKCMILDWTKPEQEKKYLFPKIIMSDVQNVTVVNIICLKVVKGVDLQSSHHKE